MSAKILRQLAVVKTNLLASLALVLGN